MRLALLCGGLGIGFMAGLLAAPDLPRLTTPAEAQTAASPAISPAPGPATGPAAPPPLAAGLINLTGLSEDEIGPLVSGTDLRSRTLVVTEYGTVAVQSGNVFKHYHADANEVQLVLAGSGSFWLGDREVQVKPGDLVTIPKGTVHAGSHATEGRFRVLAIKLPPQRPDDTHRVP